MITLAESDKRVSTLTMLESDGFQALVGAFEEQTDRLAKKLMDAKTSDQETIVLKGILNEAKHLDPRTLGRVLIAKMEAKAKKEGMGLVVMKHKFS